MNKDEAIAEIRNVLARLDGEKTELVYVPPIVLPITTAPVEGNAIPVPWGQAVTWKSNEHGGLRCEGILVFVMQVPVDAPISKKLGRFVVSEFEGLPSPRQVTISSKPGDFEVGSFIHSQAGETSFGAGTFMERGGTYFINVRTFNCVPGALVDVIVNIDPAA